MPPKKSTQTKATARGQPAEKTGTSKAVLKKEANNNHEDEPSIKQRSRHETKPAIKMDSADENDEDTADEGVPEPETPKRGPGRPPKINAEVPILNKDPGRPFKIEGVKKGEISRASKGAGGWVYAGEGGVTADESKVVAKDENGNATFPWAQSLP